MSLPVNRPLPRILKSLAIATTLIVSAALPAMAEPTLYTITFTRSTLLQPPAGPSNRGAKMGLYCGGAAERARRGR